ncbi:PP2C family protein-serine/threonine phosphatase [Evansella cellulosilytica]|uniref:Protein serine/threonine phosphatase n=1 Tax=Evansella cellulosilytica (strain ATCC 21833 / DSM 2522 / FERM P-1141 / JCM 9156 / N-4) TaxID=649639 RepID=E6TV48_EVAC2|nr:PP2C family protein-serine/threonine phosphatase [Evansella cellulosilytica]ADU28631.1 protein serine/threonine phosphatase [Evansella cellulosilytica DSM 2522]
MEETRLSMYQSYKEMLTSYIKSKSEHALYSAQQFSKEMMEKDMSPEEMVSLHLSVFKEIVDELPEEVIASFDLLLEVMIGYGLAHQEHLSLRDRQRQLDSELDVAARMQKSLLPNEQIEVDAVDLGVVSVPAGKMSGDYYHYLSDEHGNIGIAVADVIGKGVPAAMCMSMIKYAMDSLPEQRLQPAALLENLNRVVARNIDSDMFITMVYGTYAPREHLFYYASAGHEPGFFYEAATNTFEDLKTKGLVLGVSPKVHYKEFSINMEPGDFIVLLSDGVTECRIHDHFLERSQISSLIGKYKHLPAQAIAENVFRELEKIQDFELKDDFTLLILRRNV